MSSTPPERWSRLALSTLTHISSTAAPARDGVFVALCNTCHIVRQVLQ